MREIKFRGKVIDCDYDDEKQIDYIGRFVHFTGFIQCEENSGYVEQLEEISGVGFFYVDLKSVGQYTGLKDKNGREIYEGDILKIPDLYETPENTSTTYHYEKVYFEKGAFRTDYGVGEEDWDYVAEDGEVIGNIYENPELLGDSK